MTPEQLQAYCKETAPHLRKLVDQFRRGEAIEEPRTPDPLTTHMGILNEIQNKMGTLVYVQEEYHGKDRFKKFLKTVGGMDATPDYGYFGPAPNFSPNPGVGGTLMPTADGMASLAGSVGDISSAVIACVKQHRQIIKEKENYRKNPALLKSHLSHAYCSLAGLLSTMMDACEHLDTAKKYHKSGLNKLIVMDAWRIVSRYSWCASIS